MDPCPSPSGNITQYQISFQTGSAVVTQNVNIARCTAGRCSHAFEPPSNPPSNYDSVSVAAENVVGVGAARTCTTQTISELKIDYFNTESVLVCELVFVELHHCTEVPRLQGNIVDLVFVPSYSGPNFKVMVVC